MATSDVEARVRGQVEGEKPPTMFAQLESYIPQVERAIGRRDLAERLVRIGLTEIRRTPMLAKCTPESLMGAILQSAALKLDPGSARGHCWLVPSNNWKPDLGRKQLECEWWIGYRGIIELAHRSGQLAGIYADVVREGDDFSEERGTNGHLCHVVDHRASTADRGEIWAAYAHARLRNGGEAWHVLSLEQIEKRRAMAKSIDKPTSPWKLWEEEMMAKTAVRSLDRWLPSCPDYSDGVAVDGRVLRWDPDRPEVPPQPADAATDLLGAVPTGEGDGDS
jgi:recombination protein RecT